MGYYINNEEVTQYYFQQNLLEALLTTCEEGFDEFLDEVYETIDIIGIKYDVSYVLQKVDPIAYDMAMNDYIDYLFQEKLYDLETGNDLVIDNKLFMIGEE